MEKRLKKLARRIHELTNEACDELVRLDKEGKKISYKKILRARVLVKLYLHITMMY